MLQHKYQHFKDDVRPDNQLSVTIEKDQRIGYKSYNTYHDNHYYTVIVKMVQTDERRDGTSRTTCSVSSFKYSYVYGGLSEKRHTGMGEREYLLIMQKLQPLQKLVTYIAGTRVVRHTVTVKIYRRFFL